MFNKNIVKIYLELLKDKFCKQYPDLNPFFNKF
jgi:hypothetical protein